MAVFQATPHSLDVSKQDDISVKIAYQSLPTNQMMSENYRNPVVQANILHIFYFLTSFNS